MEMVVSGHLGLSWWNLKWWWLWVAIKLESGSTWCGSNRLSTTLRYLRNESWQSCNDSRLTFSKMINFEGVERFHSAGVDWSRDSTGQSAETGAVSMATIFIHLKFCWTKSATWATWIVRFDTKFHPPSAGFSLQSSLTLDILLSKISDVDRPFQFIRLPPSAGYFVQTSKWWNEFALNSIFFWIF